MARSRGIKPGFFDNEHLGGLSSDIRLLFIALWTLADKEGVVELRLSRIRKYVFGYRDDITDDDVNGYITVISRLDNGAMLERCLYQNREYIIIKNFTKHQNIHNTEKKGELPLKSAIEADNGYVTVTPPLCNGYVTPSILTTDILTTDILTTDKSIMPISSKSVRVRKNKTKDEPPEFLEFWDEYGKIGNRLQALKSFERAIKEGFSYEDIRSGLGKFKRKLEAEGTERRFIKHASTWLNNQCWNDDYTIYPEKYNAGRTEQKSKYQRLREAAIRGMLKE